MFSLLEDILNYSDVWTEIRYHKKVRNIIGVRKGELEVCNFIETKGVGIRVLIDGAFGFSSTSIIDKHSLLNALKNAINSAKILTKSKKKKAEITKNRLAVGEFKPIINDPVENHSIEEKMTLVRTTEEKLRHSSSYIISAACSYSEIIEEKYIITSDGAKCHIIDSKPEFKVIAVSYKDGETQTGMDGIGVTGGWLDLFNKKKPEEMIENASKLAVDLLSAGYPEGGKAWVVLSPEVVGLLSHEAIGHTVEADFVLSGSVASGKIGKKVASELITLVDSGKSEIAPNGAGEVLVDDEGVECKKVKIIENGVLRSYLHSRETAKIFGVEPTGNARAWSYADEPIIRMRNTYIEPGEATFEELVSGIKDGYFLKRSGGGQADANAEFMFNVLEAYRIKDGKIGDLLREVTVSGQAFEVLNSCNGISCDFSWGVGTGYCGKGQPAKIDAGGPYLRCQAIISGKQK